VHCIPHSINSDLIPIKQKESKITSGKRLLYIDLYISHIRIENKVIEGGWGSGKELSASMVAPMRRQRGR
jgi:hypothetical protein